MKSSTQTQNYYNGIAKGYNELYGEEQRKKISLIQTYLPQKGFILDAGSGTGILHDFIPEQTKVSAFDCSEELLKLNPFEKKVQGYLEILPFKNNSFDFIVSISVLQDCEDKNKSIKELHRVLKNEGKCIISFISISSYKDIIEKTFETYFSIENKINEEKDTILIGKKIIFPSS